MVKVSDPARWLGTVALGCVLAAGAPLIPERLAPAPSAWAADDYGMTEQASAPTQPAAAAATQIVIDDFDFGPAMLTVKPGTTVVWTNHDPDPHSVVSADDPKLFKSPALDTDETFAFTFERSGTYRYYCSIHPKMLGTIVVQ